MQAVVLIASLVLMATTSDGSTQPGALGGLIVEEATIDLAAHEPIVIRVRNQGQQIIVAWGVNATVIDSNGVVRNTGGGMDGYESDVRVLHDNPVLLPNDTYTIHLSRPRAGFEPVSVTSSSAYAIFDDNSAVGDERSIEMSFERRAREAAGWQFVERAMEEALASATAADGVLRLVDAKLAAASREIRDSSAGWQVPQRIRIALRSPETARSLVEELSIEAGSRQKAATARSIRRQ